MLSANTLVFHRSGVKLLVSGIVSNEHDNDTSFNALAIIVYLGNVAL